METTIFYTSIVVVFILQLWLCFKVKKLRYRVLPMLLFLLGTFVFGILSFVIDGWDALAYLIYAMYFGSMVLSCIVGCLICLLVKGVIRK